MMILTKKRCHEILAYKNLATTLLCPLMKFVSLCGCMAHFFITVAEQVGGEPTGSRKSVFFCSVDVMEHVKITGNF